jgi:acyl carrier protein
MTSGPDEMILPMLREMRKETQDGFKDIRNEFAGVQKRLDRLETGQKNFRNALSADSLMSKFLIGDFEERLSALEQKFDALLKTK